MIKNERQERITRAWAERFARSVEQLVHAPTESDPSDPRLRQIQLDAPRSQLANLRTELAEDEGLQSG